MSEIRELDSLLNEAKIVCKTMKMYGGSFVLALREVIIHADVVNIRKIKKTWPNYWNEYLEQGKREDFK